MNARKVFRVAGRVLGLEPAHGPDAEWRAEITRRLDAIAAAATAKEAEPAWHTAVTSKLDELANATGELRTEIRQEADAATPSRTARRQAYWILILMAIAVAISAATTVQAASIASTASALDAQAQDETLQGYQSLLPILQIASDKGVQYMEEHANAMTLAEAQQADAQLKAARQDFATAAFDDRLSTREAYIGQPALAVTGAGLGAVAGWILTVRRGTRAQKAKAAAEEE